MRLVTFADGKGQRLGVLEGDAIADVTAVANPAADRAPAYGIPGEVVDGNDVVAVREAVARLAERAYGRLTRPQRERARAMLLRLTEAEQPVPVGRRVALSELETERDEDATAALAVLTESRLLTVDEQTVELAHEALLREWPRLRSWIEEDREAIIALGRLREAARTWVELGRDPGSLYRGARLEITLDNAGLEPADLPEPEREFLETSKDARDVERREAAEAIARQARANRRLRWQRAAIAVALVVALVQSDEDTVAGPDPTASATPSATATPSESPTASTSTATPQPSTTASATSATSAPVTPSSSPGSPRR